LEAPSHTPNRLVPIPSALLYKLRFGFVKDFSSNANTFVFVTDLGHSYISFLDALIMGHQYQGLGSQVGFLQGRGQSRDWLSFSSPNSPSSRSVQFLRMETKDKTSPKDPN